METSRHFVATVYLAVDGAVALHRHERLGLWLPPGGHIERDELPHCAARREAREETGLDVELLVDATDRPAGGEPTAAGPGWRASDTVRSLPRPRAVLLEDINVFDGEVGHQHVDFVYFGTASSRRIDPEETEQPAEDWQWFDEAALSKGDRLDEDVVTLARNAIAAERAQESEAM